MVEGQGSKDFANIRRWAYGDPEGFQKLINLVTEATILYLKTSNRRRSGGDPDI